MEITYTWRDRIGDGELNVLHAAAFGHEVSDGSWSGRLERHSVGWVTARLGGRLVGFVNVVSDGGKHAFLLDTCTAPDMHGNGIGAEVVRCALRNAKAAGCEWMHVDFAPHLAPFYREACGFSSTEAGLVDLTSLSP